MECSVSCYTPLWCLHTDRDRETKNKIACIWLFTGVHTAPRLRSRLIPPRMSLGTVHILSVSVSVPVYHVETTCPFISPLALYGHASRKFTVPYKVREAIVHGGGGLICIYTGIGIGHSQCEHNLVVRSKLSCSVTFILRSSTEHKTDRTCTDHI